MGTVCAQAGSSVSQSCVPLCASKARKRQSIVAPMKIRPLAVAMLPPMLSVPVLGNPFALSDSTNPSGTFHAISPRFMSTATSSPNGGAEHGTLVSGSQNRPTPPPPGPPPPRPAPHPRRDRAAAGGALDHLRDLAEIHHARERHPGRRIVGEAVPVSA